MMKYTYLLGTDCGCLQPPCQYGDTPIIVFVQMCNLAVELEYFGFIQR